MPKQKPRAGKSQAGGGDEERPHHERAASEMESTMAEMMSNCRCGPAMMKRMARLMGCRGPSRPGEPAAGKS